MENFKLLEYLYHLNISPIYINIFGAFFFAFVIVQVAIPKIIQISHKKGLMDDPNERSSHSHKVPTLGGVALFFGLVVSTSIFATELGVNYAFFLSAITILFFVGLMDDLLVVAPDKKLYAQIISTTFIIFGSGIMINSLYGLFGIYGIPYWLGVLLTLIVFIVLINAYNLIDGVDGLASGIGIVISLAFIFIFYRIYDYSIGILAVSVVAVLLSFLKFNLSKNKRIFMGDTGSMVIGFILTFMAIRFLYVSGLPSYSIQAAPVILLFIFCIPVIDTLNVFVIRILNKTNPLHPDKNHLHHQFLELGFNHFQTSICLVIINVIFVIIGYTLRYIEINKLFLIFLLLSVSFVVIVKYFTIKKKKLTK
ncbi:glycosyltransferase family 4 protein [Faecalibacter macacae]|uniref:Undecaprenyl/decaprenyl-phosphate alpha-N-acetylglucosaminyl 1-phosphate transferase n=1 Tax=Faecalibacter macacae TaxID=1859289 RepID=A0A3L9MJ53_9FLAO|nr:MraY family glycosyltransferase [Faecalibacter macacae]RLZ12735.1 undecaprenyl/decaprenyl-phosphate alpha-N-acetylglucosaminyl 1-phosphate transferase [Faecalibacter macacae]